MSTSEVPIEQKLEAIEQIEERHEEAVEQAEERLEAIEKTEERHEEATEQAEERHEAIEQAAERHEEAIEQAEERHEEAIEQAEERHEEAIEQAEERHEAIEQAEERHEAIEQAEERHEAIEQAEEDEEVNEQLEKAIEQAEERHEETIEWEEEQREEAIERAEEHLEEAIEQAEERHEEVIEMAAAVVEKMEHVDGHHDSKVTEELVEEEKENVPLMKPILCTMIICIGSFAFGTAIAWPSPATPDLNGHLNPFFLTDDQNSWIGSVMTLGALGGALVGGPYMDFVGRKLGLISIQILFIAGWIVITASANFGCLVAGRVITGLAVGVVSVICPIYIGEISPAKIRGLLGSCHQLFICIGIFLTYCFGAFLSWNWLAIFCAAFDLVLSCAICFIPESPRWLVATGQKEEAEQSLRWLRGPHHNIKAEIIYLERSIVESQEKATFSDFLKPELWKPLTISVCLMLFQQFSGINVIMFYSVQIFKDAGSTMDPNTQSMLVGAVGIVGTLVSVFIVDLAGRRILLAASATLMAFSIAGIGAYFYEQAKNMDEAAALSSWLPIVCLILFNFGFDCAFGPVPWLMMGELFPQKAKGVASSIATVVNWLFAFILTKFFDAMTKSAMQTWGAYWFCCAFCVLAVPFSLFLVPETKGKTLEQIQASFK